MSRQFKAEVWRNRLRRVPFQTRRRRGDHPFRREQGRYRGALVAGDFDIGGLAETFLSGCNLCRGHAQALIDHGEAGATVRYLDPLRAFPI